MVDEDQSNTQEPIESYEVISPESDSDDTYFDLSLQAVSGPVFS